MSYPSGNIAAGEMNPRILAGRRFREFVSGRAFLTLGFILLHIPLAWLLIQSKALATFHLFIVICFGLWWAVINPRFERLAMVGGYVVSAEVMWRMMQVAPVWEFGKYTIIALFGIALIKNGRLQGPILAFVFFCLLLPSAVLPMVNVDSSTLRGDISFYLSGPLALAISVWFFSHVRMTGADLQKLMIAMIGPAISLATVTLLGILTTQTLRFSNNSNIITSGGFGPNQVSATLGLGTLAAFLAAMDRSIKPGLKTFLLLVTLFLAAQCAMTFSRGGLYMASGGIIFASFYLIRDRRILLQLIVGIAVLVLAINFFLLPRLDQFTSGALSKRFTNTRLSGRDRIAEADLQAFTEHPIFGVGPGQARIYRMKLFDTSAAHTEFSRLLAEHGIFGLCAILVLFALALQHLRRANSATGKAVVASMVGFSFLFMLAIAMRLAAPAFAFGLSALSLIPDPVTDPETQKHRDSQNIHPLYGTRY